MKTLVIVESPAKGRTISKYLGSNYIVRASFGHIRDLPVKELGVDIDNDFKPTYTISKDKNKVVRELQQLAKTCDRVLLAADPDREGEAIAWHLEQVLKPHCSDIRRIEFNEITKDAVQKAVNSPHDVDLDMVYSQQARRILDRVVGYKLSPWLGSVMGSKLSAGRVQSVALRVITDREDEIRNFEPKEYWRIIASLTPSEENFPFDAELIQKDGKEITINNKQEADGVIQELDDARYVIKSIEKKERRRRPTAPFTTSTLQQEAVRKLKWNSSKTMQVAQSLYEGVELSNGTHGLITYMRTDSTRVNPEFQNETLSYIENKWGADYRPNKPNTFRSKGDSQDAHESIRPTSLSRDPDDIKRHLTSDQFQLYKLIWDRYIASQMSAALYDTVTVLTGANNFTFRSSGSTLKFNGFMVLYLEDEDDKKEDNKDKLLPVLSEEELVDLIKLTPSQRFTRPPSKFTEATLIKTLESRGVGRPSTYASIISTLKNRGYVKVSKTRFEATDLGFKVVGLLTNSFPDIMEIEFTAKMEDDLDTIAEGENYWVDVLSDFYQPFSTSLTNTKAKKEVKPMVKEEELSGKDCPKCDLPLAIKKGKHGKFLACTGYPDCDHTEPFISESQKTDIKCEDCGNDMFIKEIRKGRKKIRFLACVGYPACKNTKPVDSKGNVIDKPKPETTDKKCPKCDNDLVIRTGRNGKFLACTGYPDCKHTEPYIDEDSKVMDCDKCGSNMVLRKGKYGYFYACTGYPKCKNILSADKDGNIKEKKKPDISDKKCPNCGKPMAIREGKSGKFYGCTGFPNCKTTLPFGDTIECSECGKPMVKRKGPRGEFWGCTGFPSCTNVEEI